jgi:hypothetical protein
VSFFRGSCDDSGVSHRKIGGCHRKAGNVERIDGSMAGVEARLPRQHFPVGRLRRARMARLTAS